MLRSTLLKFEAGVAKSNNLDGEIAAIQAELGALSKTQVQKNMMRAEEPKIFEEAKEALEQGIPGVLKAFRKLLACSKWS